MNRIETVTALREMADRIENTDIESKDIRIDLHAYSVNTRDELLRWARLIGPNMWQEKSDTTNWIRSPDTSRDVSITVFFPPDVLGKVKKTRIVETTDEKVADLIKNESFPSGIE